LYCASTLGKICILQIYIEENVTLLAFFSEAETLLERLTESMDNIDDTLLLKIHLLLVDTYLHTYKAEKASKFLIINK